MIKNRESIGGSPDRELALDCILAGIESASPATVVPGQVSLEGTILSVRDDEYDLGDYDRCLVLGAGNAAAAAARALEDILGGCIDDGIVVTDNPVETEFVTVLRGSHPVPSQRGVESTREMLELASGAGSNDIVFVLITGGGSALLPAPADGVSLSDLQETTDALLACGASVGEINVVRKHLSGVKGGRLAGEIAPSTTVGLVFSDVIGNPLDVIASGPLTPDRSTFANALDILERYELDVPEAVGERLRRGAAGEIPETPSFDSSAFDDVKQYVLADGQTAITGAATVAREAGYEPLILSSRIRGEARDAATTVAAIAEECVTTGNPIEPPAVLLSGGETTVTLRGDGTGGPNQEFALSAALELKAESVTVASVDTDGIDGVSSAAGGIATPGTATPEAEARRALDDNDAGGFLRQRGGAIVTGPTDTNVNDLRLVVVADRD